ncbi:Xaa-Pro dipeptidase [Xanthomonadaceae bacterium XH05]|nr:Xaa-Pro dipeptidase [Xanthomonadaceae bacterium XH05]
MNLAPLYAQHLSAVCRRIEAALERSGHDHLLIPSGVLKYRFLDDNPYPFAPNPHFLHLVPLLTHTDCWIVVTPGKRPVLVYHQPADYWHITPTAPEGFWVEHFDIHITREPSQATAFLPKSGRLAIVGEADAALDGYMPNNPPALVEYLHYHRACKTPYELACMREASRRATLGHVAAEAAFRAGASEFDIHRAYLGASSQNDSEAPYGNIVALNEHAAVLHYQRQDRIAPTRSRSFLIDAGASFHGYASDITRTCGDGDARFQALIDGVEQAQLALVDEVRDGRDYRDLHLSAHLKLAGVLQALGVVRMSPEAQLETGVSSAFFPHGIGHLLGLQVHDVAGFSASDAGGVIPKPEGHPYLRLTRALAPGMVVTIEPGLYFIDLLLAPLRAGPHADAVDWSLVEHLAQFGGVRIEDDVVCTTAAPENLTRDAFAAIMPH